MNRDSLVQRLASDYLGSQLVPSGQLRTAGEIRHVKDNGPVKRKFVQQHDFSPKDLKALTKVLWQVSVALGHLTTATNSFTRMKSVKISPDGRLGGSGYDRSVKDMRKDMYTAVEALSGLVDTLHDEVTAPHWHPELLPPEDAKEVDDMVEEVERIQENPEGYADGKDADQPPGEEDEEDDEDDSPITEEPVIETEPDGEEE